MSEIDNFLNSLSEEERKSLEVVENSPDDRQDKSPEELVLDTYTRILDMHIASGQVLSSDREQILQNFRNGNLL